MVKKFALVFGIVFLIGFLSASFEVGNLSHNLTEIYGPRQNIQGWINVSFSGELTNSIIEDSRGNSIELLDLLNLTTYDYDCSPLDCGSDYSASNAQTSKTFVLNSGESVIAGLFFESTLSYINSIKFSLTGTSSESQLSQIAVDVLDDGSTEIINYKEGSTYGAENYGCFQGTHSTTTYLLGSGQYCQKIEIAQTPSLDVGAWIKNNSGGRADEVTLELFDSEGDLAGSCYLEGSISASGGYYRCSIDYLIKETDDYYVCIYSDEGFSIKGYADSDGCGFYGYPPEDDFNFAYSIFVKPKYFAGVGTLEINNSLQGDGFFSDIVEDYIYDKYGDLDCSTGCVVPIKISSFVDGQSITIKNLEANYVSSGGVTTSNNFYDVSESPAKINSGFGKLYIDGGDFEAPSSTGDFDFILSSNGVEILNIELSVEDIPVVESLSPTKTASALPTEFEIEIDGDGNVSEITWEFGDNSTETTTSPKVIHTYSSIGIYTMKVTLEDDNGMQSSKTFSISVGSPEEIIEEMLGEKTENLENILLSIEDFNNFQKQRLEEILDLENSQTELERIDLEYYSDDNRTEDELNSFLTDLLAIEIPEYIVKGTSADDLIFYPESAYINLDVLKAIGEGDYEYAQEDSYAQAIISWNQINLNTKISFEDIYASYNGVESNLLTTYEVSISEREDVGEFYFIVDNLDDLVFDSYGGTQEGDYTYLTFTGSNTFLFSTSEEIEFSDLPVFISPAISKLDLTNIEVIDGGNEKTKKWLFFGLAIVLLILIAGGVYFALHNWYKKKYENYLFKDKNNLYNLINYIHVSEKKGMSKEEIIKNLKKAKWTNEQINYVMRKYSGKGTGMPGLIKEDKIEEISNKAGEGKVAKK